MGKCRDELGQVNRLSLFHPSETSWSEIQQTSIASASGNPSGERLHLNMTEEGPTGVFKN